jgi:fluoride ion exporter CrcB/FEX
LHPLAPDAASPHDRFDSLAGASVGLGGGLGSLLHWLTGRVIGEHYHGDFPVGTFLINV